MIRINDSNLDSNIGTIWLDKAKASTKNNRDAADYVDKGPSWSEIKPVYLEIQGHKCAYCEKPLVAEDLGATDMEHYRPKSSVKAWPTRKIRRDRKIDYSIPENSSADRGYYLLTHHLWNYVASCKKCNSLKSNFFPTQGPLVLNNDEPRNSNHEQPYLLYPLGDHDVDPETLIRFEGVLPILTTGDAELRMRALVTLDFFNLVNRSSLIEQRAGVIDHLYHALLVANSDLSADVRSGAIESVSVAVHDSSAHASCARSFKELFLIDRDEANRIFQGAHKIHTKSLAGIS